MKATDTINKTDYNKLKAFHTITDNPSAKARQKPHKFFFQNNNNFYKILFSKKRKIYNILQFKLFFFFLISKYSKLLIVNNTLFYKFYNLVCFIYSSLKPYVLTTNLYLL